MAEQSNLEKSNPEKDFNEKLRELMSDGNTEVAEESEPEVEQAEGLQTLDVTDNDSGEAAEAEELESGESEGDKKPVTAETAAIIALKKKLKDAESANKLLKLAAEEKQKANAESKKQELVARYLKQGYDEDTAGHLADQEIQIMSLKQRADVADFREENADLLERYPAARKQIVSIIDIMAKTGWTAEQVLRGMYGVAENPIVEKNRSAVAGTFESKSAQKAIGEAARSSTSLTEPTTLSAADRKTKAKLEEDWKTKLTNERYFELKEKYDL